MLAAGDVKISKTFLFRCAGHDGAIDYFDIFQQPTHIIYFCQSAGQRRHLHLFQQTHTALRNIGAAHSRLSTSCPDMIAVSGGPACGPAYDHGDEVKMPESTSLEPNKQRPPFADTAAQPPSESTASTNSANSITTTSSIATCDFPVHLAYPSMANIDPLLKQHLRSAHARFGNRESGTAAATLTRYLYEYGYGYGYTSLPFAFVRRNRNRWMTDQDMERANEVLDLLDREFGPTFPPQEEGEVDVNEEMGTAEDDEHLEEGKAEEAGEDRDDRIEEKA